MDIYLIVPQGSISHQMVGTDIGAQGSYRLEYEPQNNHVLKPCINFNSFNQIIFNQLSNNQDLACTHRKFEKIVKVTCPINLFIKYMA